LRDLLPPLPRERQQFNDASVRSTNLPGGEKDLSKLAVVQYTITRDLFCRQRYPVGR
jgi:hypothetical protein